MDTFIFYTTTTQVCSLKCQQHGGDSGLTHGDLNFFLSIMYLIKQLWRDKERNTCNRDAKSQPMAVLAMVQ